MLKALSRQAASAAGPDRDAEAQRCTARDEAAAWSELILADRVILNLEIIQKSAMKVSWAARVQLDGLYCQPSASCTCNSASVRPHLCQQSCLAGDLDAAAALSGSMPGRGCCSMPAKAASASPAGPELACGLQKLNLAMLLAFAVALLLIIFQLATKLVLVRHPTHLVCEPGASVVHSTTIRPGTCLDKSLSYVRAVAIRAAACRGTLGWLTQSNRGPGHPAAHPHIAMCRTMS